MTHLFEFGLWFSSAAPFIVLPSPPPTITAPVSPSAQPVLPESKPPRPLPSDPWPSKIASLKPGWYSTSAQQRFNADKWQLPVADSEVTYQSLIQRGEFIKLTESTALRVIAKRPYVRIDTAHVVNELAEGYYHAGCGALTVTDAGRLTTEVYRASSPDTVHPYGLAVDLRLNFIPEACAQWLRNATLQKEAALLVDATEHGPPHAALHLHLVVVPKNKIPTHVPAP